MSGMELRLPTCLTVVIGRSVDGHVDGAAEPIDELASDLRALDVRVRRGLIVSELPTCVDDARPIDLHTLLIDIDTSPHLLAVVDLLTELRRRPDVTSVHVNTTDG